MTHEYVELSYREGILPLSEKDEELHGSFANRSECANVFAGRLGDENNNRRTSDDLVRRLGSLVMASSSSNLADVIPGRRRRRRHSRRRHRRRRRRCRCSYNGDIKCFGSVCYRAFPSSRSTPYRFSYCIHITGTLKHVKSFVVRAGGIVLRWSSNCQAIVAQEANS